MKEVYTVISQHIFNQSGPKFEMREDSFTPIVKFFDTYEEAHESAIYSSEATEVVEIRPRQFEETHPMFLMMRKSDTRISLPMGSFKVTIPAKDGFLTIFSTISFNKI